MVVVAAVVVVSVGGAAAAVTVNPADGEDVVGPATFEAETVQVYEPGSVARYVEPPVPRMTVPLRNHK